MNYKKNIDVIKNSVIEDLQGWVKLGSVYDANTVSNKKPFGDGVAKALEYIALLAKKDGFKVDTCDGYVTEITYDLKKINYYGFWSLLCCGVGNGWSYPPFGALLKIM